MMEIKLSPLSPSEPLPLLFLVPTQHCPLGHVHTLTGNTFLGLAPTSLSNGQSVHDCFTEEFGPSDGLVPSSGLSDCITLLTGNVPRLMLQLFNFCLAEEKGGLSLSLTVQLSTVAEGGEGVSIPPSVVRRLLKAHVLPTSAGKLRPGSLTHHHPSLLRPLNPQPKTNPHALFSLETQMKLEIL